MLPKDAEGIANSVDPDQTALLSVCCYIVKPDQTDHSVSLGAVWSGYAPFAQTYLSFTGICIYTANAILVYHLTL